MVSEKPLMGACLPLSLTWTVKLNVPAWVGVPLSVPPELKLNPGGRAPAVDTTDHV